MIFAIGIAIVIALTGLLIVLEDKLNEGHR
jgi:hypothetical protein